MWYGRAPSGGDDRPLKSFTFSGYHDLMSEEREPIEEPTAEPEPAEPDDEEEEEEGDKAA